jgi:hypothetical protein
VTVMSVACSAAADRIAVTGNDDEKGGIDLSDVPRGFRPFGVGVSLRHGRMGRWYCGEHRPNKKIKLGENARRERARATEVSLSKVGE